MANCRKPVSLKVSISNRSMDALLLLPVKIIVKKAGDPDSSSLISATKVRRQAIKSVPASNRCLNPSSTVAELVGLILRHLH